MQRQKLLNDLTAYKNSAFFLPEEEKTWHRFVDFITSSPACFERSHKGHITTSVWIVNEDFSAALLTHHKKFNLWVQLGGHNDGDADCKAVALKEAEEESGIKELAFLMPGIFDIDIHLIPSACEYHYDVRYLLVAKNNKYIVSDESHDLAWVKNADLTQYATARSVTRMQEKFQKWLVRQRL